MQLAIELPDELGRAVLQHDNMQEFIKRAIEQALSAEKVSLQTDLAGSLKSYASGYIPTEQAVEQAWQEASNDT
jgi:hypothetical protein